MQQRSQDCIEHRIEVLAHVFGEEPQHEEAVFLQQKVFASVATVAQVAQSGKKMSSFGRQNEKLWKLDVARVRAERQFGP